MSRKTLAGFSLFELLGSLLLLMVLLALAVPSYQKMISRDRTVTQINQLVGAINFARSEAIQRHLTVTLCASSNGKACTGQWRDGWIIFVDKQAKGTLAPGDKVLRSFHAIPQGDNLLWLGSRSQDYLQMSSTGGTRGQDGTFVYCPHTKDSQDARAIIVSQTGRLRISEGKDRTDKPLVCV